MQCHQCGHVAEADFTYCPACGAKAVDGGGDGLVGRILKGKYRVLEPLGTGSMGSVYLAEHTTLQKKFALKVLHRELQLGDEALRRFQREGVAAGKINHRNAIQIFDFDQSKDGTTFLAMEYVDGRSLRQVIQEDGTVSPARGIDLVCQLLETLAAAHAEGVVHRDLKPENLMVVEEPDGSESLKVLDFGLSKLVDRRADASLQTMVGKVMGTPLYMSPEQWNGDEVDARSDLYSAGLVLYELLSGVQPFKADTISDILVKSTTEDAPSILDHGSRHPMPLDLDPVLTTALERDPEERFQDAEEMLEALEAVRLDRVRRASKPSAKSRGTGAQKRSQGGGAAPNGSKTRGAGARTGTSGGRKSARGSGARSPGGRAKGGSRRRAAPPPEPSKKPWILGGAIAGVVALIVVVVLMTGGGGAEDFALVSRIPAEDRTESQRAYVELLAETRERLRTGDVTGALASAGRAARAPAVDAEAFVLRGMVYRRHGDVGTGRLDYHEAQQRLPGYGDAMAGLGWLLLDEGKFGRAKEQFTKAREADPKCGEALAGSMALLLGEGKPAGALGLFDGAADAARSAPNALVFRGEALVAGDQLAAAKSAFTQAKRGNSSLWRAYRGLAVVEELSGDLAAAEQQCVAGLAIDPENVPLKIMQANLQLAGERFQDASTSLESIRNPGGEVQVLMGLAKSGLDDGEAAVDAWQSALEQGVKDPASVRLLLAMAYAKKGEWDACQGSAVAAVEAAGSGPAGDAARRVSSALYYQGLSEFRLGDATAAAETLAKSVQANRANLDARYTLGVLYMNELDRPGDAVTQFRAYVGEGGADPRVPGWLESLQR